MGGGALQKKGVNRNAVSASGPRRKLSSQGASKRGLKMSLERTAASGAAVEETYRRGEESVRTQEGVNYGGGTFAEPPKTKRA